MVLSDGKRGDLGSFSKDPSEIERLRTEIEQQIKEYKKTINKQINQFNSLTF